MTSDSLFGLAINVILLGGIVALVWHSHRQARRWDRIKLDRKKHWGIDD